MFRTIAIRNEPFLRASLSRASRGNVVVRALSVQTLQRVNNSSRQLTKCQHTPKTVTCSVNLCRQYSSSFPSHIKVLLPALSPTMEQGTIISWEKKEGDKLNEGDLLAEIETDKATMGFETPEEGYLAKILIPAGTKEVAIGKLVCIIVENEADVAAFKDFKDDGVAAAAPPAPKPAAPAPAAAAAPPPPPPVVAAPAPAAPSGGAMTAVEQRGPRVYASPMAKKLAETQQLRLEGRGSGVFGSITSKDLTGMKSAAGAKAGASAPGAGANAYFDIPVTGVRGVIAKRLLESKTSIPHYYMTVNCEVDKLMKFRAKINKKYEKEGVRVSVNDFIIKAVAIACRKVPETNSMWMGDFIRQYDNVDVSVAVSSDRGLITPIVFSADRKGVVEISKDVKMLAGKARDGKLQPHEFQGGTVSVSNLGMFGIAHFCPVINPPQSCILGIGTTEKKLVADPDSLKGFKEVTVMSVTLSCDHRTVDGAVGAKWLQHFKDFMEDPQNMIL